MKKILLISLFVALSTLTFADQKQKAKHHKSSYQTYETDEYEEDYTEYKSGDLIYDWDQDFGKRYNNDVVLNIGNSSYSMPIQLKSVMVKVDDETCVAKERDVTLKPRYQVRVGLLPLTSCFDITKRMKFIDAINLASGTPEVRSDTVTKDAVVSVNYINKDGVNTQKTSTFRLSFFKTSH
jgi:hypothetical protein